MQKKQRARSASDMGAGTACLATERRESMKGFAGNAPERGLGRQRHRIPPYAVCSVKENAEPSPTVLSTLISSPRFFMIS